jgi:hypothetical protein
MAVKRLRHRWEYLVGEAALCLRFNVQSGRSANEQPD